MNASSIDTNRSADSISPPTPGNAPNLQNIDRAEGGLPQIAGSGFHMPPGVLGQAEDNAIRSTRNNSSSTRSSENNPKKKTPPWPT